MVLFFQRGRVQVEVDLPGRTQHVFQSTRMIEVAVTEHDHLGDIQRDFQALSIVAKHFSLTRIKQDAAPVGLYPKCQSVFAQEIGPANSILGQHGDSKIIDHGRLDSGCAARQARIVQAGSLCGTVIQPSFVLGLQKQSFGAQVLDILDDLIAVHAQPIGDVVR